jgi:hypothetical protein
MEIFDAARRGDDQDVIRLLDADPTLLEAREHGERPFAVAANHGRLEVMRLLMERQAHVGGRGPLYDEALHCAAYGGHEDLVAWLLGEGADANAKHDMDATPLMMAAAWGRLGVVKMLLQHTGGRGLTRGMKTDRRPSTLLLSWVMWRW